MAVKADGMEYERKCYPALYKHDMITAFIFWEKNDVIKTKSYLEEKSRLYIFQEN